MHRFKSHFHILSYLYLPSRLLSGLPDEKGRIQILHIHTAKMRQYELLANDVDVKELAVETKNYSGAELEGLVRAAQSTAMNRHIRVRILKGHFLYHDSHLYFMFNLCPCLLCVTGNSKFGLKVF